MDQISDSCTATDTARDVSQVQAGAREVVAVYAADQSDEHFPGKVLRRETGFYLLQFTQSVKPGRKLVMRDGHFRFELEAISSQPCEEGGFAIGCSVVACRKGNVRQEWRLPTDQPARLKIEGTRQSYNVRVKDTSPFGMGVESPVPLERDTLISIETPDGIGSGEIRHSRPCGKNKFFCGIQLNEYKPKRDHVVKRASTSMKRSWRIAYLTVKGFLGPFTQR